MDTLSLFPELLFVGSVMTPFILRLLVAYAVGSLALQHIGKQGELFAHDLHAVFKKDAIHIVKVGAALEIAIAALLAIGLFTQAAALLAAILFAKILFFKKMYPHFGTENKKYYWILLVLSLCIFLSGAGPFAFDLPL